MLAWQPPHPLTYPRFSLSAPKNPPQLHPGISRSPPSPSSTYPSHQGYQGPLQLPPRRSSEPMVGCGYRVPACSQARGMCGREFSHTSVCGSHREPWPEKEVWVARVGIWMDMGRGEARGEGTGVPNEHIRKSIRKSKFRRSTTDHQRKNKTTHSKYKIDTRSRRGRYIPSSSIPLFEFQAPLFSAFDLCCASMFGYAWSRKGKQLDTKKLVGNLKNFPLLDAVNMALMAAAKSNESGSVGETTKGTNDKGVNLLGGFRRHPQKPS